MAENSFDGLRRWLINRDPFPERPAGQRNNYFDHWYALICAYSSRDLTFSTDVFAAITGVANAMREMHECTFSNGLWLEDLPVGLTWYVLDEGNPAVQPVPFAPTWSWASQWGKNIRFSQWEDNHMLVENESVRFLRKETFANWKNSECAKFSNAPFRSPLLLNGRLKRAKVDHTSWEDDHAESQQRRQMVKIRDENSEEIIGDCAFDNNSFLESMNPIWCLLVTARKKSGQWHLTCLALVPVEDVRATYKRVGLISLRRTRCPLSWYGILSPVAELRLRSNAGGRFNGMDRDPPENDLRTLPYEYLDNFETVAVV